VREADRCTKSGEIGALLRREGLYSSHLVTWRAARDRGELEGLSPKRVAPQLPLQAQGCVTRAPRVILVRRSSQQRHDAVAAVLVDRALEAMDAFGENLKETIHDAVPLLRVELGGEFRRSPDVGKQDRHLELWPMFDVTNRFPDDRQGGLVDPQLRGDRSLDSLREDGRRAPRGRARSLRRGRLSASQSITLRGTATPKR
jgi:hypothetical protein